MLDFQIDIFCISRCLSLIEIDICTKHTEDYEGKSSYEILKKLYEKGMVLI